MANLVRKFFKFSENTGKILKAFKIKFFYPVEKVAQGGLLSY